MDQKSEMSIDPHYGRNYNYIYAQPRPCDLSGMRRKTRPTGPNMGLDFSQATQITNWIFEADVREAYAEERWVGFGLIGDTVVAVVFTLPAEDVIRILSLRKAEQR